MIWSKFGQKSSNIKSHQTRRKSRQSFKTKLTKPILSTIFISKGKGMIHSLLENLLSDLDKICKLMDDLIEASNIRYFNWNQPWAIFIGAPEFYWDHLDEKGIAKQTKVLNAYVSWYEIIEFLFSDKPDNIKKIISDLNDFFLNWIQRTKGDHSIPGSIQEAKEKARSKLDEFRKYINWLEKIGKRGHILIPDTNSLIKNPNIQNYGKRLNIKRFTIIFIPTVLGELDNLKIRNREPLLQKKAESMIRRIKGYRIQGHLHNGITIYKNVTVKMVHYEPRIEQTLGWLDKDIPDDRIIASALEIQRKNIGAKAILVTSDINLQNKAEAARLPYIEDHTKTLQRPRKKNSKA